MPKKLNNFAVDAYKQLLDNLEKYLRRVLTVEYKNRSLSVADIKLPSLSEESFREQKKHKINGLTLSDPVKVTLVLKEDGKVLSRKTVDVLDLPRVTKRGTYIVKGSEYSFPLQKRLLTGVYTNESKDGITAWVNSGKGVNLKITLRQKTGDFILDIRGSTINMTAVLMGLGYTQEELVRAWGRDVFQSNIKSRGARNQLEALKKVYSRLQYKKGEVPKTVPELRKWIVEYFQGKDKEQGHEGSELDPENVKLTLGKPHSNISPALFLEVTRKVLRVSRGDEQEDNKESLLHNHIKDISDFVVERLETRQYRSGIKRAITKGLRSYEDIRKIVPKKIFNKPVESTFTQTALARSPKQNNPMDEVSDYTEITVRGEGGITSLHQIKHDVRAVDPSHFGFLDPLHTPEGENIGTTLHLSTGSRKVGNKIKLDLYDIKAKKDVSLDPREVNSSVIAFREYFKGNRIVPGKNGKVKAMHKGKMVVVKPSEITHAIKNSSHMFDVNTLAIPFLAHNNGTRGMTAAKMQTQAKPLLYREEPLVQCAVSEGGQTIEKVVGEASLVRSPVDGVVVAIKKDSIIIRDKGNKKTEVEFRHNFWQNDSYTDDKPIVSVGDKVKKGQILVESNYTKNGTLALGTNLRTAYVPYKGYNYEDGVVVSESGAKKLTSMHGHQKKVDIYDDEILDKKKFLAYFPSLYSSDQLNKLDENGIIKPGQTVLKGDPLVIKMKKVEEDSLSKKLKNVSRLLVQDFRDTSSEWKKDTVGEVAEVVRRRKDIFIVVKTSEKAKIGDKIVGRYGNKGTITSIIPDKEMPRDEEGNVMDLLLNPNGVAGRMNMGQILETTVSKSAIKNKKIYKASPFGKNHTDEILKKLKKEKIKDHGKIYDPVEDKYIDGVLHGHQYIFKMEHQVEKKLSARGAGIDERYSEVSGQPARGDSASGQAIGVAEVYALLAHGADSNLKEMFSFKGDKSMEAWRAIENNTMMPPPQVPTSSKKFVSMLHGMGVNLTEEGKNVKMVPFLDKDVKKISHGEVKDALRLRGKDLKEEKGGLFDISVTGGVSGDKYSHIKLSEPMPHPTFEKAITSVLHINSNQFNGIMSGELGVINGELVPAESVGAKSGGLAIKEMLSKVNVNKRIKEISELSPKSKGTELNKLHREARVLRNFRDNNIKLTDMVVSFVPVIPPKFRGIIELPNGSLQIADVNEHYSSLILSNKQSNELRKRPGLRDEYLKSKKSTYEAFKGVTGFGPGIVEKDVKGFAGTVAGSAPKFGWFQSKMLKRRQEVSSRGVVSPDPKLNMDTLGVPENMAWKMFSPFVRKELKSSGLTTLSAQKEIDNKSNMALTALKKVMAEKHVFMNRAPTLHRHGMMAFKPKLVAGSSIRVPVEVTSGFNMDFDGDTAALHVAVTRESNEEAKKALPSSNIYLPGRKNSLVPELGHEYILGLYKLTRNGKTTAKRYLNKQKVITDFEARRIRHDDIISVKLIGRTTAGKIIVNEALPERSRDYQMTLKKGQIKKKLIEVDRKSGREEFKKTFTKWKHLGRKYSYLTGSSLLLSDMKLLTKKRNEYYRQADRLVDAIRRNRSLSEDEKKKRIIDIYTKVDGRIMGQLGSLPKNSAGKTNNISDMSNMGVSKPGPTQVKQLVGHLGLLMDHRQQVIMEPVRGNYGEGLSSSDYWAHSYSQRKGMIDKSREVSGPGMLSKELNNAAVKHTITMVDCGTTDGRMENVDKNILDRALASTSAGFPKNKIIDEDVLSKLQKQNVKMVKIRTPLTCQATSGMCANCYGVDETGNKPRVGKRIGLLEIQAITERSVQLPMKAFHTGGAASGKGANLANAFDRALEILRVPDKIRDKAELSRVNGMVQSIKKTGYGSQKVMINGVEHEVPPKSKLLVSVGSVVKKGQKITEGSVKPQELLALQGVEAAQEKMRDDLHSTFQSAGVNLTKRTFEIPVKMITESVRIIDPGDCHDFISGDYSTVSKVKDWNNKNRMKKQIVYTHDMSGMRDVPHKSNDWAQRMGLDRIQRTIRAGAATGLKSRRGDPFTDLSLGYGTNVTDLSKKKYSF